MLERDGWVFSSQPVSVAADDDGLVVERHRQAVSPEGEIERAMATIAFDFVSAGKARGRGARRGARARRRRREIPTTARPLRSTVVRVPALRVLSLYPELMNIYADRGNIAVLRARCEWRGLGFEHAASSLGEPRRPGRARPLLHGRRPGPRPGRPWRDDMVETKRDALHAAAGRGAVVLAVCGGYQLLGHSYELGGEELPGVGLVDLRTVREPGPRLIGNCAIEADLGDRARA